MEELCGGLLKQSALMTGGICHADSQDVQDITTDIKVCKRNGFNINSDKCVQNNVHRKVPERHKDERCNGEKQCSDKNGPNSGLFSMGWMYEPEYIIPDKRIKPEVGCHQHADSLFSSSSGFNNYRGLLNLGIILLVLSNSRLALENIMKYGILVNPLSWVSVFLKDPYNWPCVCLVLLCNVFIMISYTVETNLSKKSMSEYAGWWVHVVNQFTVLTFPAAVIYAIHPVPLFSSAAMMIYTILFLKLESYRQVNMWCRAVYNDTKRQMFARRKTVAEAEDLPSKQNGGKGDNLVRYPDNINLKDMYYFMFAPTLCYELNFPRSARIRKRFLIKRLLESLFLSQLILMLTQQWILPIVQNSLQPFTTLNFFRMIERLLKLSVPNHFIWLIGFYWLFHSLLNVVAEVLRFGDRIFYRDWWNAETIEEFWKNWNIPVHKWASRHLYKPLLKAGQNKLYASVAVFLVSAFFHEYLVSVPLRMFRIWAFMAMLSQVPLAIFVRHFDGKTGNMMMWISLIIGQPAAMLMYYHDYYVTNVATSAT